MKKTEKAKGKMKAAYVEVSDDPDGSSQDEDDSDKGVDDNDGDHGKDDDGEDDGDHRGDGEVEEEDVPPPRIGPPARKKNAVPPPKTPAIEAAGPSSPPLALPKKRGRKPKILNGENQEPNSKKRPAEEELVPDSPQKTQKTGPLRKSGRVAKAGVEEESKNVSLIMHDLK